jgi:3-hydroxyisobutyrate dehydrogenase
VRAARILSFEGSVTKVKKDSSLHSGQAWNIAWNLADLSARLHTKPRCNIIDLEEDAIMMKVGFIGLGRMGSPMATNLVTAGFDVTVYDIRRESLNEVAQLGAKVAHSPKQVASLAEIVEVAVVDDAQVEDVILGIDGVLAGIRAGSIIAVHSTISPKTILKIAELAQQKGVQILDAQVSGGEMGAQEKQLCYMVGGEREVLERCRPLFSTSGTNIFHVGSLGSGAKAKMILQVVVCINMLAAGEAEHLCEASGVDFQALRQILRVSSGQSFVCDHWFERFKRPNDPKLVRQKRTEIFCKSLSPALELAGDLGLSLPGTALALERLAWVMGVESE